MPPLDQTASRSGGADAVNKVGQANDTSAAMAELTLQVQDGGILQITPLDILAIFSLFYLASRLARRLFPRFLGRDIPAKKTQ